MLAIALVAMLGSVDVESPVEERQPRAAIDVHPFSLAAAGVAGGLLQSALVFVPVTASFIIDDRWALTAEADFSYLRSRFGANGWTFSTSVGATFFLGAQPLSGWFIAPKFTVFLGRPAPDALADSGGPLQVGNGVGRAFTAGVDAGYQWRRGRLHVALVLGISAGYGYDTPPVLTPLWFGSQARVDSGQGFVWGANLNLLRLGIAL